MADTEAVEAMRIGGVQDELLVEDSDLAVEYQPGGPELGDRGRELGKRAV